jgi:hypothetical protein
MTFKFVLIPKEILEGFDGPDNRKITLCSSAQKDILRGRELIKTDLFNKWYPWLSQTSMIDFEGATIPCTSCRDRETYETTQPDYFNAKFLECTALSSGYLHVYALRQLPLDYIILEEMADMDDMRPYICPACLITLRKHYNRCRTLMFDNLPRYFDLGSWEQLIPLELMK